MDSLFRGLDRPVRPDMSSPAASFCLLIQSTVDPWAPIVVAVAFIAQFVAFALTLDLFFSTPLYAYSAVSSSSEYIISASALTICSICDLVMTVRESSKRRTPHQRRQYAISPWDSFNIVILTCSLLIIWIVICLARAFEQDSPNSYQTVLTRALLVLSVLQTVALLYVLLIRFVTSSQRIDESVDGPFQGTDDTIPSCLYAFGVASIINCIVVAHGSTSKQSLRTIRDYSAIQMLIWTGFVLVDLIYRRIPWCNFVKFFAGPSAELKWEITVLFTYRTIIPLSWVIMFSPTFVFERVLELSGAGNFGIPCIVFEGMAIVAGCCGVALYLRTKFKALDSAVSSRWGRESHLSGLPIGESRRSDRTISIYGALEVF